MSLDLATLRAANAERQAIWCGDHLPDLSFRGNELAGETGEACNIIKKLERQRHGWRGSRSTTDKLAEELADVVITADLTALTAGIDLDQAIVAKFNATSVENGIPVLLHGSADDPFGTDVLVDRLAVALKAKLRQSADKPGRGGAWAIGDWREDCQRELLRHAVKGDPLDVAAYAAFCHHHGWPTAELVR